MKRLIKRVAVTCVAVALTAGVSQATTLLSINAGNDSAATVNGLVFDNSTPLTQLSKVDIPISFTGPSFTFGGSSTSGTWSISGLPAFSGLIVAAVAIKASNEFILVDYTQDGGVLFDNWCTDGTCSVNDGSGGSLGPLGTLLPPIEITNQNGNAQDLSHLTLYGFERGTPPIPEPATWLMMIAGFAVAAAAVRRRTVRA